MVGKGLPSCFIFSTEQNLTYLLLKVFMWGRGARTGLLKSMLCSTIHLLPVGGALTVNLSPRVVQSSERFRGLLLLYRVISSYGYPFCPKVSLKEMKRLWRKKLPIYIEWTLNSLTYSTSAEKGLRPLWKMKSPKGFPLKSWSPGISSHGLMSISTTSAWGWLLCGSLGL